MVLGLVLELVLGLVLGLVPELILPRRVLVLGLVIDTPTDPDSQHIQLL